MTDSELANEDALPTIAPTLAAEADLANPAAEAAEAPIKPAPEASTTISGETGPTSMEAVDPSVADDADRTGEEGS